MQWYSAVHTVQEQIREHLPQKRMVWAMPERKHYLIFFRSLYLVAFAQHDILNFKHQQSEVTFTAIAMEKIFACCNVLRLGLH